MSGYKYDYSSEQLDTSFLVHMASKWFSYEAFNADSGSEGVDYVLNMIENEEWKLIHEIASADKKYEYVDTSTFRRCVARNLWEITFYMMLTHSEYSANYIREFLEVHKTTIVPILEEFYKKYNCRDGDDEYGAFTDFIERVAGGIEENEWSGETYAKLLQIPELCRLIPESIMDEIKV